MSENKSKQIAIFRYGIISDFVNHSFMPHGKQEELLKIKSSCKWKIPYSNRNDVSRSSILRWIKLYKDHGETIEALCPKSRNDVGKSRVIDGAIAKIIERLAKDPDIHTVPELKKKMKGCEVLSPASTISITTIYRFLHSNDLMDYLKNINTCKESTVGIVNEQKEWVQKLFRGEICIDDLKEQFQGKMRCDDIEKLYGCLINGPLRFRRRATIVLSFCNGISMKIISQATNFPNSTVYKNIKTYIDKGVDCIISDKNKRYHVYEDNKYIDKVFSILHAPPTTYGFNRTTWIQKDILQAMADSNMQISKHALKRIIDNSGYKYRKAKITLTSNDPNYKTKVKAIQNILADLRINEKFFSIDEYGPFAIKMHAGKALVPAGTTRLVSQWQKSKGSIIITAALELSTNQVLHFYSNNKNTAEMIKLLDLIIDKYSDQERIYFSWDAASWHASKELHKKVDEINAWKFGNYRLPFVRLAPLPTCAQFLNVIESVFSGMARAIIHNSDYNSIVDCKAAIDRYFSDRNEYFQKHPKKAGNKIWGKERVKPFFTEYNNCKDPMYR